MTTVQPVPNAISALMPMLLCRDASAEIDFCKSAFRGVELNRRSTSDGTVVHALVQISSALVMIEGEWPGLESRPPELDGSSPVVLYLYVEDVDAAVSRGLSAGAKLLVPVEDRFWGDRTGRLMDPAGHVWTVATRIEETTAGERERRWSNIIS